MENEDTFEHERIARRAYEIYVAEGMPEGRDAEHWKQAEEELNAQALAEAVGEVRSLQI
jgi:hypothetical protein